MKTTILCFLLLFTSNIFCQHNTDILLPDNQIINNYLTSASEYSNLYYGKIHIPYLRELMVGSYTPYLLPANTQKIEDYDNNIPRLTDFYSEGRLIYNGILYPKENMLLDLYRNDLVIFSPGNFNIILDPEKVEMAEVQGYHVYYLNDKKAIDAPQKGYYLLLEENEYCRLIKKDNYDFVKQSSPDAALVQNIRFYILKDETYHQVKSKRSVLKVFNDKRKELETYIKENRLEFDGVSREQVMRLVVKQYEKLKKQ